MTEQPLEVADGSVCFWAAVVPREQEFPVALLRDRLEVTEVVRLVREDDHAAAAEAWVEVAALVEARRRALQVGLLCNEDGFRKDDGAVALQRQAAAVIGRPLDVGATIRRRDPPRAERGIECPGRLVALDERVRPDGAVERHPRYDDLAV